NRLRGSARYYSRRKFDTGLKAGVGKESGRRPAEFGFAIELGLQLASELNTRRGGIRDVVQGPDIPTDGMRIQTVDADLGFPVSDIEFLLEAGAHIGNVKANGQREFGRRLKGNGGVVHGDPQMIIGGSRPAV